MAIAQYVDEMSRQLGPDHTWGCKNMQLYILWFGENFLGEWRFA